jgi:hypothetical protein
MEAACCSETSINCQRVQRERKLGTVARDYIRGGGGGLETIIFDLEVPRHCPLDLLLGVNDVVMYDITLPTHRYENLIIRIISD